MEHSKHHAKAHLKKGRGAVNNAASHRFNAPQKRVSGDWLDDQNLIDGPPPKLKTEVFEECPKSILNFNMSPDLSFDRSVNPYRGCEHGCIYCFARPTHAFHELSPGQDFESKLFVKPGAAELLRQTLGKPQYRCAPLAIGTNTDPYQPIEQKYKITRKILELMVETKHPIGITTKSGRILRDKDLLQQLSRYDLTMVAISVTTLDRQTARRMEPRASAPLKRLRAMEILAQSGVYVHASIAPVIPAITDHEIEQLARAAANHGARSLSYIPIRLPHEVAPLFQQWLHVHYPDRAKKVMSTIASMRSGKKNDPAFYSRMKGKGAYAKLLEDRVKLSAKRHGLNIRRLRLRTDLFQRPALDTRQLELFSANPKKGL